MLPGAFSEPARSLPCRYMERVVSMLHVLTASDTARCLWAFCSLGLAQAPAYHKMMRAVDKKMDSLQPDLLCQLLRAIVPLGRAAACSRLLPRLALQLAAKALEIAQRSTASSVTCPGHVPDMSVRMSRRRRETAQQGRPAPPLAALLLTCRELCSRAPLAAPSALPALKRRLSTPLPSSRRRCPTRCSRRCATRCTPS